MSRVRALGRRVWQVLTGRTLQGELRRNINAAETIRSMVLPPDRRI